MKKHLIYWLAAVLIVAVGCQKELSFEGSNSPAKGSLQADVTGDCLPKTVNGTYVAASALVPATNTITVQVNVGKTGTYVVGTDTVNGYYFRGTGTFTTLGATNVTLRGNGTPFAAGVNNFVVSFDTTFCDIQVTVLPVGSGPAVFTLQGSPASCSTPVINGTYVKGGVLNASNTVVLKVDVTTAGTYNVTTALTNGMTFTGTGSLAVGTGQTITLVGSGTPTNSGNSTIPVTAGSSNCSFVITVVDPVTGTLGGGGGACTPVTINGTYTLGVPLVAGNTVQVQITTSAVGPYSVSTGPLVAGISFSASGTSNGATQTITLTNNGGTPSLSGPQNFTVTFGTSTCTFSINIGTGASAFIADCSTATPDIDGLYETGTQLNCGNTIDIVVNVTATGPYNIVTTATNGMTFSASGTFSVLGNTTITLVGSGTPINTETSNIPMPGTTPCTFPLFVDVPLLPIGWQFTRTNAPSTIFRGQNDFSQLQPNGTTVEFGFIGSNSIASDALTFLLSDFSGTINNGETYSTSALPTGNYAIFQYSLPGNCFDTYDANLSTTGVSITLTVSNHSIATQTITGTFTGTAKNGAGQPVTIATGTFTGTY